MNILVALPVKLSREPLIEEGLDYLKRTKKPLFPHAVFSETKGIKAHDSPEKRMVLEGQCLLEQSSSFTRIALCPKGKEMSSEEFARFLEKKSHVSPKIAFLIGGAHGLAPDVLKACDSRLSLSNMTLPHRMAFLFLAEQIYRAGEIMNGGPYHK
jgi:23S rRNA (pseudouridine1915-N3)-methyltransferase